MTLRIGVEQHPSLFVRAFSCELPGALATLQRPEIAGLFAQSNLAGIEPPDDALKNAIRDVLRARGYKPTGRGKPSSEYLVRAQAEGALRSINLAVDAGNAISLHSGVPISVVDLERVTLPLQIRCGGPEDSYVFNPAGQTIALAGLPCLWDATGPCANAVKDAQRTKTSDATLRTLSILWGSRTLIARCDAAYAAYTQLLRDTGMRIEPVAIDDAA